MKTSSLRAPHDLGEIVGYAYRVYAGDFVPLFLIAVTTMPLAMLQVIVQRQFDDPATGQAVASVFTIPAALVTLAATAALIFAVNEIANAAKPEFARSIDAAFERFVSLLTSALLGGVIAIAAFAFAFPFLGVVWLFRRDANVDGRRDWWMWLIPGALGLYLLIRWLFVPQAVMIEDRRNWSALDASAGIVRGRWWRTLGIMLVVGLIELGPILLASITSLAPPLAEAITTSVVAAAVLPFATSAQTLLFYDLKARKQQADVIADRVSAAEPNVPREGP